MDVRIGVVLAAILLVAAPLSLLTAHADAAFTDPAGDVVAQPAGTVVPDHAQVQATDIVGLDVTEGEYDWTFRLKVASYGQQGGTVNTYAIDFTWDDAMYRISLFRSRFDPTSEPLLGAELQLADGAAFNKVIDLDVAQEGDSLVVTFGKLYIASLEGHAPVPGSELTDVIVTSRSDFTFGSIVPVQLLDTLVADRAIVYTKGGTATGHIVLEPADPVRISNGGSGTFVYTVHVQNLRDTADTVQMSLSDIPAGWTARVHPQYTIPPQEEVPVVLTATLPFGHTHGGFSALTLTATSVSDPAAVATVRLGVVHTPIPQPAGHHAELYLHAVPADSGAFQTAFPTTKNTLNTLSDHATDEAEAYPDRAFQSGPQQEALPWSIGLGPQLAMGLDFDLDRVGSLTGSLMGRTTGGATLDAQLWLIQGDRDVMQLASAPPSVLALDLQAPTSFTFALTPLPGADLVPYAPGQNLQLRLALTPETPCCPPQTSPTLLVEGFVMSLPLNEYHEGPVINEEGREIIATIEATPEGPIEKQARPGTTKTYAFMIKNTAARPVDVRIETEGISHDILMLVPGASFRLDAGGSLRLLVGIQVPTDANDGQILEAVLLIRSATDPANLAIARMSTVVSTTTDAKDERDILAEAQGTGDKRMPSPSSALALLTLAAAALLLAQRRR